MRFYNHVFSYRCSSFLGNVDFFRSPQPINLADGCIKFNDGINYFAYKFSIW